MLHTIFAAGKFNEHSGLAANRKRVALATDPAIHILVASRHSILSNEKLSGLAEQFALCSFWFNFVSLRDYQIRVSEYTQIQFRDVFQA